MQEEERCSQHDGLVKCTLHQRYEWRSVEQDCFCWGCGRAVLYLRPKSSQHGLKARGEAASPEYLVD